MRPPAPPHQPLTLPRPPVVPPQVSYTQIIDKTRGNYNAKERATALFCIACFDLTEKDVRAKKELTEEKRRDQQLAYRRYISRRFGFRSRRPPSRRRELPVPPGWMV